MRLLRVFVFVEDDTQDAAIALTVPVRLVGADPGGDEHRSLLGVLEQIGVDRDPDVVALVGDELPEGAQTLPAGETAIELA